MQCTLIRIQLDIGDIGVDALKMQEWTMQER